MTDDLFSRIVEVIIILLAALLYLNSIRLSKGYARGKGLRAALMAAVLGLLAVFGAADFGPVLDWLGL